jgi:ribonuclease-3
LIQESGPDHQKVFALTVEIHGTVMGRGEGRTKKEAEQRAAEQAFTQVGRQGSDSMKNSHE